MGWYLGRTLIHSAAGPALSTVEKIGKYPHPCKVRSDTGPVYNRYRRRDCLLLASQFQYGTI